MSIKYLKEHIKKIDNKKVDELYKKLLNEKYDFINIISENNDEKENEKRNNRIKNYILTKEKSFFEVEDIENFIKEAELDIYYKTQIISGSEEKMVEKIFESEEFEKAKKRYIELIDKYKEKMQKKYADKYIFGSVAVRIGTTNSFVTTKREKENLNEHTIVYKVDTDNRIISAYPKKATLNAPLLYHIFENKKVNQIIHINHEYDESLEYYSYAFPGTVRDSIRCNNKSFNISNHGFIKIYDKEEREL